MRPFLQKIDQAMNRAERSLTDLKRSRRDTVQLLRKELSLAASPLSLIFVVFGAMTLIPSYPILVGGLFVCLGIFYSFQNAREANDLLYSVMLPVTKAEVVGGKYAFVCFIELLSFVLMAVLTVLRMTVLRDVPVYMNNVMMAANPFFLGCALLLFASFNALFVGGFFKTAYKFARPLVFALIVAVLIIFLAEALHHVPGLEFLNDSAGDRIWIQCVYLALCAVIYAAGTLRSCHRAMARFEKIDL